MSEQKPSVCRIVQYRIANQGKASDWRPAVVTEVWSDTCVNLEVFFGCNAAQGLPSETMSNPKPSSVVQGEALGQWRWPPRS